MRLALLLTVAVLGCATALPTQPAAQPPAVQGDQGDQDAGAAVVPPVRFGLFSDKLLLRFSGPVGHRPITESWAIYHDDPDSSTRNMGDYPWPTNKWGEPSSEPWQEMGDFPFDPSPRWLIDQ